LQNEPRVIIINDMRFIYFFAHRKGVSRLSPKVTEEHKEQRRKQILDAAVRVFIRKGYEPATMKDIVEEAQMSRGWIYLYFQSKEEIFEALVEQNDRDNVDELKDQLARSASVWEAFEANLAQHMKELGQARNGVAPAFFEYYTSGWRDKNRRAIFERRYASSIASVVAILNIGVERGEFKPAAPLEAIAKFMSSHLDGILMHSLAGDPEQIDIPMQIDMLAAQLKQLLGVRQQGGITK